MVQGDEACDLGKANSDGAEAVCRTDCTHTAPFCGNGEVQGDEKCDLGKANSDGAGAVCRMDCTYAPAVCGDGAVQASEACDRAIPAADGADAVCDSNCELRSIYAELLIPCGFGPSTILVDGLALGNCGEAIQRIPPGLHTVTRRRDRTVEFVAEVNMVAGKRAEIPNLPAMLTVTLNTTDAEILLNGKLLGKSVLTVNSFLVEPGFKQLQIMKSGYVTFATGLSLSPGVERSLVVTLKPLEPVAPVAPAAPPIPAAPPVPL